MLRKPAVAGRFYPGGSEELEREIDGLLPRLERGEFYGALVPHAGYMYSGKTAGAVYSQLALPPSAVILGPNHTGAGSPGAVWARGAWATPLGEVEIDEPLAGSILAGTALLEDDPGGHMSEHSIEVQLPFLKRLRGGIRIVPVSLMRFSFEECSEIARAISSAAVPAGASLIATTDMTHYEPEKSARARDKKAIEAMLALDGESLHGTVEDTGISMCGYVPAVILIEAVKNMGAKKAELAEYTTSARASGDYSSVVGYCGMVFR